MSKRERQGAILQLVREQEISTQAELVEILHEIGFDVVQTTVSRDVAELGLVKVRGPSGRLVYAPEGTTDFDRLRELQRALRRWALNIEASGNLVVVTTPSGHADPLAERIDEASHPMVLGTLAGENTIFLLAREGVAGADLRDELRKLLEEGR
jgi:transcriptional regulator of arginine metabolism